LLRLAVMSDLKSRFFREHPFLSQPGTWIAAGHGMSGDPLDRLPIQGRIRISHEDGRIINTGEMSLVSKSNPVAFGTSYNLTLSDDELALDFFQANEPVGNMTGKVVIFDDRLVSAYASGDGTLRGFEVLHKMGENRYAVTGILTSDDRLVNLWKLDLVRPAPEAKPETVEGPGQD